MEIKAKKSLGQNFLIDKNIIQKIINCTEIKNKTILEVGPGTGNLTKEIVKKNPKKIILIEKDKLLFEKLKSEINFNATFINDDILKISEENLSKELLTVFGNLPYNISTKILTKWILFRGNDFWFNELILLFQKEVADRIISKSNTKNYGRLSILANWKLNINKIIDIKSNCFRPVPKIDSTLLVLQPKKDYFKLKNSSSLEKITRVFFNQKRKKIKKPYFQLFRDKKVAELLNIDLDLRPQNIDKKTYYLLAQEHEKLSS